MHFCWVTLPIRDLERSLEFYHGLLGLPINSRHSGEGMEMAMLGEAEQPKIELISLEANQEQKFHADISLGIAVDSLEDTMEYLKENQIPIVRGPLSPAPHISFIFIQDPDGYQVQLVEMK